MKPVDIKSNTYINFGIENNDKGPKSKVGDHVRISKFFYKVYARNRTEKGFVIQKVTNTVSWTCY